MNDVRITTRDAAAGTARGRARNDGANDRRAPASGSPFSSGPAAPARRGGSSPWRRRASSTDARSSRGRTAGWLADATSHRSRTGRFFRARRAAPEVKFFSTTIPRTSGAMAGSKRTRADAGADEIEEAELALVAQKAKVAGGGSNDASTAIAISTKGTTSSRLRGVKRTSSLDAPIMLLEGHADGVNGVKFSPDGTVLASCGADKVVNLWKVSGDCEVRRASIDPIRRSVRRSDSSTPRSNQTNPTRRSFIRQPPHRRPPPHPSSVPLHRSQNYMMMRGHKNTVLELHWTADGDNLVTCSPDKSVRCW